MSIGAIPSSCRACNNVLVFAEIVTVVAVSLMIFASAAVSLLITEISTVCDLTSIAFVGCNCAKEGAITNDTIDIKSAGPITILLKTRTKDESTVVVSAGKRKQAIEEIPVSMEIIKPQLIDNKGITDLEQAVDQTPGVYTMDGQVSIRGGSGFAYGTGSRVLLLWNGMPLLSGYAGDTQWNAIPMEQASQIEVMKGASSVLYGSGALNGVIALAEKEPKSTPETKTECFVRSAVDLKVV